MGYIDIHSHILPGLDDGSQSLEQSLQMLQIAVEEGIDVIFATPHYKSGHFRADSDVIQRSLQSLREAVKAAKLPIHLCAGTEIYYRKGLEERLDKGSLLTMNGTELVLVEFSPFEDFNCIRNAADDLLSIGYHPIIAHIERYRCILQDIGRIEELRRMGCRIQVNAGSIAGDYGMRIRHFTGSLLRQELIDFLGTDAHNAEDRKPLMQKCAKQINRKCRPEYAERLLHGNAETLLLGTQTREKYAEAEK